MAADTNSVVLVGRLTRDPELRAVGDTHVLTGRLAFTRREKQRGEWTDTSHYVDVTLAWGARAEGLAKHLTKGSRIGITGSLRYREWEKDGQKRNALDVDARDVQLLDGRDASQNTAPAGGDLPVDRPASGGGASGDDESIPFAPWRW